MYQIIRFRYSQYAQNAKTLKSRFHPQKQSFFLNNGNFSNHMEK